MLTSLERTSIVERGLYVLRFIEGPETSRLFVSVKDGSADILPAPGRSAGVLMPNTATTIIVHSLTSLEFKLSEGDPSAASLKLELFDKGVPVNGVDACEADSGVSKLKITAHVSRLGDVTAGDGEWIAGFDTSLPIEGLAIETGNPHVSVVCHVIRRSDRVAWVAAVDGFAGSRQQADPLLGIRMALAGRDADRFLLEAEARVLGAPSPGVKTGRTIEFASPDCIVGLRISLARA